MKRGTVGHSSLSTTEYEVTISQDAMLGWVSNFSTYSYIFGYIALNIGMTEWRPGKVTEVVQVSCIESQKYVGQTNNFEI